MNDQSESPMPWVTVARFTNWAEVGYFADLLEKEGCATNLDRNDEFSAIDGSWNERYLLQVKPGDGIRAAELMKQDLAITEEQSTVGTEFDGGLRLERTNSPRQSRLVYRVAISIVLIGAALLVAERLSRSRLGLSSADGTLWEAIGHLQTEFRSSEAGRSDTRLFHDKSSDTILLIDDVDRDGRYDRLRRYREGRLVETIEH